MRQTLILRLYVFWKISVAKPHAKLFSFYNLGLEAFVHGSFADFYEVKSSFLLLNEVLFISITLIQFIPYLTLVYRMITLSCNPFCSKLQCISDLNTASWWRSWCLTLPRFWTIMKCGSWWTLAKSLKWFKNFNVVLTLYIVFEVIVDFSALVTSIKNDSMHNLNVGVFK